MLMNFPNETVEKPVKKKLSLPTEKVIKGF
jgi:hypothetical protein